jgi:hypothetical protein
MIPRLTILNLIFENFTSVPGNLPYYPHLANKYIIRAELLIEVLEVIDCGSIGGFDKEAPVIKTTKYNLYDRYLAVLHKYNKDEDIQPECGWDIKTLTKYFKALAKLPSKI